MTEFEWLLGNDLPSGLWRSGVLEAVDHVEPRWSPDGKNIVFQNIERTKFSIKVVNLATRQVTALTDGRFMDLNPVWSQNLDQPQE